MLHHLARELQRHCTECGACRKDCLFLQTYGLPKAIASAVTKDPTWVNPFECSLCHLCAAVCPEGLQPAQLFWNMRCQAHTSGVWCRKPWRRLLLYESIGRSPLFSLYHLPPNCNTVFFPGCSLSGTRAETTWQLYQKLKEHIPNIGLVLHCCSKPSHDLGDWHTFSSARLMLQKRLCARGVSTLLVACPSCYGVLQQCIRSVTVRMIWNVLGPPHQPAPAPFSPLMSLQVHIHDSCMLRNFPATRQDIRHLTAGLGLTVCELPHQGRYTLCCGEGGAVGYVNPLLARQWGQRLYQAAGDTPVVTSCTGCSRFLSLAGLRTWYLGDLLTDFQRTVTGQLHPLKGFRTYWHRLRLKKRLC